jgi:SMI1/KNR4 family protein SUKH-1
MTDLDTIRDFLSTQDDISLGYSDLYFYDPVDLEEMQEGFFEGAKSWFLFFRAKGAWRKEWIAIGNDDTGDPLIVDLSTPKMRVLCAEHGTGHWEPYPIADSLKSFGAILDQLRQLATDRDSPAKLETKPLTEEETNAFLQFVRTINPEIDPFYWEILLDAYDRGEAAEG